MSKFWDPDWAKESVVLKGNMDPEDLARRLEIGEALGYPRMEPEQAKPCLDQSGIFRMAVVGPDWTGLVRGPNRRDAAELQEEVGRLAFYFICSRPSVRAVPESTQLAGGALELGLRIVDDEGNETETNHSTKLPKGIDSFELRASGRTIAMLGEDSEFVFDLGLVSQMNLAPRIYEPSIFDLKIHYIGKARGELRESCALDRLETHSQYQEITEEIAEHHPNRDVWVVLAAGTTMETLGGANAGVSIDEVLMHEADARAREMLRERDRIDLTEALLINYFKPERNTVHKENLDLRHTVLKRCYEAGFTGLLLSYSSKHLGVATYTDAVEKGLFHNKRTCLAGDE